MGTVCGRCGEQNRDGARFCAECGSRLSPRCTTCDAELTPGAKFDGQLAEACARLDDLGRRPRPSAS
jgi:predicted amidophosphoribosyltransferase